MEQTPRHPAPAGLTAPEVQDLELIVGNAKAMGWLAADEIMVATRDTDGILVSVVNAESRRERRYSDAARWLYQLLHELAQGAWKDTSHIRGVAAPGFRH